jgi:DNA-binding transcriptional MerR regulator/mannose-6-phosphate isomerase-like protein (cupin superfamily)
MSVTDNGTPLIAIGEAARIVGVSPQTLRLWGNEGLVRPVRSKGGTRYYRDEDVQRLKRIKELKTVHGLNTAAVRREIGHAETPPSSEQASRKELGKRLRSLRARERKTLQEVSEVTGLSRSFLSTLENGDTGASVASLSAIAQAYGTSMRKLLGAGLKEGTRLLRPGDRRVAEMPNGVKIAELAAGGHLMDPTLYYVPPNAGSDGFYSHQGEEFMYVVKGSVFVELKDEDTYRVQAGDVLYFPSTIPHRWWTEGEEAEIVYVNTPPAF